MKKQSVSVEVQGHKITFETGEMAQQADGSVVAKCGDNMVLATVVSSRRESTADFFPLTVEYAEKFYSTGRIPGGYFKREGRPTGQAILNCRLIDRPLRPCFPEGYRQETQVVATILSADAEFPIDILASLASFAAVHVSDIPFNGPLASTQVGRVNGQLKVNLSESELENSDLNFIISGTKKGILMVEGEGQFISEADALAALKFGYESLQPILQAQDDLRAKMGSEKREFTPPQTPQEIEQKVRDFMSSKVGQALKIREKKDRYQAFDDIHTEAKEQFVESASEEEKESCKKVVEQVLGDLKYEQARKMILDESARIDGRGLEDIRDIHCEVSQLPRAHGSGLFTRGETQVLSVVTLGTADDEQMIDALHGTVKKRFLLHYNFPPYSVGETGRMGGQSRREIGHGFLAERSLVAVLPDSNKFPYTIRVVGEVLGSNGSSSMGTVCSGILAMLDAGVPIKDNVAGIAMGLIKEDDRVAVLSDILGDEDHLGDMDFKVAGSREGITALQMDIKIDSLSFDILEKALSQAYKGRCHILDCMEKTIKTTRGELSPHAPRIEEIKIHPDKVREVIGAGGKVIRGIIEETGAKINIEDDGTVRIASSDLAATKAAIKQIEDICAEAEVGKTYLGKVLKITDFGAFVEVLPNTSGLLHISELAHERVRNVTDVLKEGEEVKVKVLDVDRSGRIRLSRKALLENNPS